MSEAQEFLTVGKIRDAHGLKGEVFVILFAKKADWLEKLKSLRLVRREQDEDGKTVVKTHNFPILRHKLHKKGLIVKAEGLDHRTAAESFCGAMFEIPKSFLISEPGEKIYLNEIEGFSVELMDGTSVGAIHGFSSNGAQDLMIIALEGRDVEVPLVPAFVKNIDFPMKRIVLDPPPGLLD